MGPGGAWAEPRGGTRAGAGAGAGAGARRGCQPADSRRGDRRRPPAGPAPLLSPFSHRQISNADCLLSAAQFVCPITGELMQDPVTTEDGITYERTAIEDWLSRNLTSPVTNQPLSSAHLVPNVLVRGMVRRLQAQRA